MILFLALDRWLVRLHLRWFRSLFPLPSRPMRLCLLARPLRHKVGQALFQTDPRHVRPFQPRERHGGSEPRIQLF